MFLLGTLLSANAQLPSYVPSNGLVAFYPLDSSGIDLSSYSNNLIGYGLPIPNKDRTQTINKSVKFQNGNDYFLTPTTSWSLINNFPNGTVSFWVNIDTMYVSGHYFGIGNSFMVKQKHGVGQDLFFGLKDGTTQLRMQVSGFFPSPSGVDVVGATSLKTKMWYHVVGVWDGTYHTLYINGKIDGRINNSIGISNRTLPDYFSIGSILYGGNGSMNYPSGAYGSMDDIGIWNRALDSNEIKLLYIGCGKKINQQPADLNTSSRIANFTCIANDTLQTYQWQILENGTWIALKDSAQFTGTKTSQLTINQLLVKNNGSKYRCVVRGNCLNETSVVVTLKYTCSGSITKHPVNQGMFAGSASFSCDTDDTLVSYQWETNSGTGWSKLFNAGQYSGVYASTLRVANVTSSNNNQLFRCIVKGDCLKDTTNEATLRVWGLDVKSEQIKAFKVYPNPTKGQITIENGDNAKMIGYTVSIYNSIGQQLFSSNITQQKLSLDITQFGGNGLYFMEITDNTGNIVDFKKIVLL
jgi:hypothetical protein